MIEKGIKIPSQNILFIRHLLTAVNVQREFYLGSDIKYTLCDCKDWGKCKVDADYRNGPGKIEINGNFFKKGIVAHARSVIKFQLDSKYDVFSSCIGISKSNTATSVCGISVGDARFRVWGDHVILQNWIVKGSPEDPTCIRVVITDVNELTLETDLNFSRDCDFSTWVDAKVAKGI